MSPRLRHALVLLALAGLPPGLLADTPPPATPDDDLMWEATLTAKPTTGVRMGTLPVRFETTTLDDVRRLAGAGNIAHHGDAAGSEYWLCYTNPRSTPAERIWIVAHGEMGGPDHVVTSVSAELLTNGGTTADCPELPDGLLPLSLDNGVWLGASEEAVVAVLGRPSHQEEGWLAYNFEAEVRGTCEGGVIAWLLLHFQGDGIRSLEAGQVTSC